MRRAQTAPQLRSGSFEGAEGLQGPLNDTLQGLGERVAVLEQSARLYLLGPRRIVLPVDASTTPESAIDFQLPESFTPRAVFLVELVGADAGPLGVTISPAAVEVQISGNIVRVLRITTATTTGVPLNLTMGALRG